MSQLLKALKRSWESKGTSPNATFPPQEIAGLIKEQPLSISVCLFYIGAENFFGGVDWEGP